MDTPPHTQVTFTHGEVTAEPEIGFLDCTWFVEPISCFSLGFKSDIKTTRLTEDVRTLFAALLLPVVEVRRLRLLSPVALQLLPLHLLSFLIHLDFRRVLLSESLLLLSEGQQSLLEL